MDYSAAALQPYANDPMLFAQWMADEGFIKLDGLVCSACGKRMELRCTTLLSDADECSTPIGPLCSSQYCRERAIEGQVSTPMSR